MTWRTFRLVPVAALSWGMAALVTALPQLAAAAVLAGLIVSLAALAILFRARRRRRLWLIATVAAAFAMIVVAHVACAFPQRAAVAAFSSGDGRALVVEGHVTGKVQPSAAGVRFDTVLRLIERGREVVSTDVPVTVQAPGPVAPELDVGARIRVTATAFTAEPGARAVLVLRAADPVSVVSGPGGVLQAASWLRHRLVSASASLPGPGAGLIPGLSVGDTSAVSPALADEMKAASLTHLTAVSGANCALVTAIAFALAALCGAGRVLRVGVALAALVGFVVLTTPEPSVVRAGAMSVAALLALMLGRPAVGMSILSLGVAVLMAVDPWLSRSLGFALSVAATAALLVLARPLAQGLTRFLPRALALAIAVPLSAQLVCAPLIVLITPSVPVYAVVANLLAAPAAPVATLIGLLACLSAPVPVLQLGLTGIAWLPATWIAQTASVFAGMPGATLPWLEGWWGCILLAVFGALTVIALWPPWSRRRWLQRAAAAMLSLILGVFGGTLCLVHVTPTLTTPAQWTLAMCDIGQGDAVLLRSAGHVALIDTGPDPDALSRCLSRLHIERLDLAVFTHFDLDHVGGAPAIRHRVDVLLHGPATTPQEERLVQSIGAPETRLARRGMTGVLGDAAWRVLWPASAQGEFASGNPGSVVLEVKGGGVPVTLLLADLDAQAQRALARSGVLPPAVEILKVAHHGSADYDAGVYRALAPRLALISVGAHNRYGHPTRSALETLRSAGAVIARTDRDGLVLVDQDAGGLLRVWREHAEAAVGGGG